MRPSSVLNYSYALVQDKPLKHGAVSLHTSHFLKRALYIKTTVMHNIYNYVQVHGGRYPIIQMRSHNITRCARDTFASVPARQACGKRVCDQASRSDDRRLSFCLWPQMLTHRAQRSDPLDTYDEHTKHLNASSIHETLAQTSERARYPFCA